MATITARATSGSIYNVLDPNTWVGGVVPGENDIAVFPSQALRTTFNQAAAENYNAYTPWTGIKPFITVGSTVGFPKSGSIYAFPQYLNDVLLPVKIDYQTTSSTNTQLISCSIDNSYREWRYENSHSYTESYPGENPVALGAIIYNTTLFSGYTGSIAVTNPFNWQNRYQLTGSATWSVATINMNIGCDFTLKNSARLVMNHSSSTAGVINVVGTHSGMRILDTATFHMTGSINSATGSTNVTGILQTNVVNTYFIISGSANYSSSYLASSSAAGTSTLTLSQPDSFGVGDVITVQTIPNMTRLVMSKTGSGITTSTVGTSLNRYVGSSMNYDYRFRTGSYYGAFYFSVLDTGSHETDDVVQVEKISGSVATISRRFGKQGSVQQDLGLFNYQTFTQTYGATVEYFTGNRRAVLVDSQHLDYQPGELVVISGSAATVLYTGTFLSQSQFIDFTNTSSNDWTRYIDLDQYAYSGSGYVMTPANTYNPTYRKYTLFTTASRAGRPALYINTASLSTPALPVAAESYVYAYLKNTYFKEGEIEISGSIVRDFVTTASLTTSNDFLGVFAGSVLGNKAWAQGSRFSSQNTTDYLYDAANGFIVNGFDFFTKQYSTGQNPNRVNWPQSASAIDVNSVDRDMIVTPFTGSNQSFTAKLEVDRGVQRHYLQGVLMDEFLNPWQHVGQVSISLMRYASLFSIRIKNRYQLVLLDTQDAFNYGDRVKQGGLIDTQQSGKLCKFIANEIEDPMGFRNLVWDYHYKKGQTNLTPCVHSFIYTTSGSVQDGISLAGLIGARPLQWNTSGATVGPNVVASYGKSGTDFYITYDLGTSSIFDTVGVGHGTGGGADTLVNYVVSGSRIDVSDDPDNWTTVWARQNDTRLTTGGNAIRFYTFPSGSVNKRFIRFYSNGLSGSAAADYNKHNSFGVYCFATGSDGAYGSNNTTNQIKLRNAKNFAVGDTIMFWNKEHTGKRTDSWATANTYYPISPNTVTGYHAGTITDAGTVGGLTDYYTITAMSGSVITLDRAPAYDHLFVGTTVMKVNRGGVNFTGGNRNCTSLYWYGNFMSFHVENMNMWNATTYNGSYPGLYQAQGGSAYGATPRNVVEDVFVYSPQRNRFTITMNADRMRNIIGKLSRYPGAQTSTYTDNTAIGFNIFNYEAQAAGRVFMAQRTDRAIHNHIVELNSGVITTIYSEAAGNASVVSNSMRRGKWFVKNNYWHTYSNDPRSIDLGNLKSISEQVTKSFVWDTNNFWNGGMITGYGSITNGNVASTLYNQLNLIDYRNLHSAAPMLVKKAQGIYGVTKNVHGTLNQGNTSYTHAWFNGFIDTTRLRLDKPKYLRLMLSSNMNSFVFDENGYYSLWVDNPLYAVNALGNFLTCTFNLKQDADVRIQLNMQARVNLARKHAIGVSNGSSGYVGFNYTYYGLDLPKVLFVDLNRSLVLDSKLITSASFQDAGINQTYSLKAGDYAVLFEPPRNSGELSQVYTAQHLLDYTEPTLNILTADVNNIDVYINNWDNYKMLRNISNNNVSDIYYKDNIGAATVARTSTNLTTTTRFNRVKL